MWSMLKPELRRLKRRPGEFVLAVLVLAAGLGSTLFVLGAINAFLWRPLPFPQGEQLVQLGLREPGGRGLDNLAARDFLALDAVARARLQIELAAVATGTINISDQSGPLRHEGGFVSHDAFDVLGIRPQLGRGFSAADDVAGAPLTLLLGDAVWRHRFHADPAVLGRSLRVNGQVATVIGIMPADFAFPRVAEVWIPLRSSPQEDRDSGLSVSPFGRLRAGMSAVALRDALSSPLAEILADRPERFRGLEFGARPLARMFVSEQTHAYMWLMLAAAFCVLLVACANVANLLLSQVSRRSREIALRRSLGAGRGRLILITLSECLLLSGLACVLGIVVAQLAGDWVMRAFEAAGDGAAWYVRLQADAVYFTGAIVFVLLSSVLAGLLPALRATRGNTSAELRGNGALSGSDGGFARFSRALVVAEIAFCCVLLIGAGATVRSLEAMVDADTGTLHSPERILTGRIGLFPADFPTGAEQVALFERVASALQAEPQVASATVSSVLPGALSGATQVEVKGAEQPQGAWPLAENGDVDDGFADTYGLKLLSGRLFDGRDQADSTPVVVIDAELAQQLFGRRDPLGQQLRLSPGDDISPWRTIVGVVAPLQLRSHDDDALPALLSPMRQRPVRFASPAVRLKEGIDPLSFAPRLAEIVRSINADTPVYWTRTQARAIEMERIGPSILAHIFGGFGLIGLLLAGAGLYGVLSFHVSQRTQEIGLRRAIGAGTAQIVRAVTARSGWQVALGLLIGCTLGVPWAMLLSSQSLGVQAIDPVVFGSVLLTLVFAALLACWLPTRRALAVPPLQALRME